MPKQGINFENVKKSNRSAILKLLNNRGPMSRKDIAVAVGLTPASVTMICSDLLEEGIITEIGEAQEAGRVGRKKILVSLNSEYRYVFCVGIESEETYISITDLMGKVIKSTSLITDASMDPENFLSKIADNFKALMWESDFSKDQILGVGVSIPGKVDCDNGISINTYSIWDRPVNVTDVLSNELGLPVFLDNNLKAYALSELFFGTGRTKENLLVLKWGPGVGSSIVVNQSIYQGAHGNAAEVGHMIKSSTGKKCKCGRRGCLQTEIATHAIIETVINEYGTTEEGHKEMPLLDAWLKEGNEITYQNTEVWCGIQDKKLQDILDEKVECIIHAAVNIATMLDPNRIVVFGYLFDAPGLYERFMKKYLELDPTRNESFIVKSTLPQKQYHTEALSIVLDRLFY